MSRMTISGRVKVVAGLPRSGKTDRLLAEYRTVFEASPIRAAQPGESHSGQSSSEGLWLCPSQHSIEPLRSALLRTHAGALLDPRIVTFAHFAEGVIAGSGQRIRPVSALQKRRVLQLVIAQGLAERKLSHFAAVARTPGFLELVNRQIVELKRQDVWPEDYAQQAHTRREQEIAGLYAAYQKRLLAGQLYDAEGRFWAAREILKKGELGGEGQSPARQYGLVVVDGFSDFTSAQYDILRLLAAESDSLQISLTLEQESLGSADRSTGRGLLLAKTRRTLERLQGVLPNLEIEFRESEPLKNPALERLRAGLFEEKDSGSQAPACPSPSKSATGMQALPAESEAGASGAVRSQAEPGTEDRAETPYESPLTGLEIVAAHSVQGEVEAIAGRVKQLLLSQQARPEEIVVVFRQPQEITFRIGDVFGDYGIPHFLETPRSLATSPLVRLLVSLLRLQLEDWPFGLLLRVAGNRMIHAFEAESSSPARTEPSRAALEKCLRAAQLPAGRQPLLEQCRRWAAAAGAATGREVPPLFLHARLALEKLEPLSEQLAALPKQAGWQEWVLAIEKLLVSLGVISGQSEETTAASRTWRRLRSALRSIEVADIWSGQSGQFGLEDLISLLEFVTRSTQLPPATDSIGRVRVLTAESARHTAVKHLFLVGLGEQAFSSRETETHQQEQSVEPIESGKGQSAKGQSGNESTENESTEMAHEETGRLVRTSESMLLFYELVTRASESLTLSYPALDEKGQSLPPSPLLVELQRTFGATPIPTTTMTLGRLADSQASPLSQSAHRQQAVAEALAGRRTWLAGLAMYPEPIGNSEPAGKPEPAGEFILEGLQCIAQRAARDRFGPHEGLLLSETAQAALAERFDLKHLWSPSQLEGYAACPFRFFSEQLLGLQPVNELTLRSDAARRGSLLHQVLAEVHDQLKSVVWQEESDSDLVARFLQTLQAVVEANPLGGLEQSLREIECREIAEWAPLYVEQENQYRSQWDQLEQPPQPTYFEVRFGPKARADSGAGADGTSTSIPFELDLGSEPIRLIGQIDRVDVGRVGGVTVFNIIDYKSGKKEMKLDLKKVRSGHQLQLPLYVLAAEQHLLAEQDARALATGYWNVREKGFEQHRKQSGFSLREVHDETLVASHPWEQLQPQLLERVQQIVTSIRSGHFPVYNEDNDCTKSCPCRSICRIGQIRSLDKKWDGSN